jgi:hypothetical protein
MADTRTEPIPSTITNAPPEPAASHRLTKRQRRRRRAVDRDFGPNAEIPHHPLRFTETPTGINSEQERQQRARMRRIQGRDSLRSEVQVDSSEEDDDDEEVEHQRMLRRTNTRRR